MSTAVTTDPKWTRPAHHNALERFFLPYMKDERDLIFIRTAALITCVVFPLAIGMFMAPPWFVGLAAVPYVGFVFAAFGARFGLMVHAVGHRPIFKREHRWMQNYIPWVLGPFHGHTPTSFEAHHMWMHHAENNMLGDGSCTLPYTRDQLSHFLHYFARFFFMGYVHLPRYLWLRGRKRMVYRFYAGELYWYALVFVTWQINWAAALAVFVFPMVLMRFLMMAGNFAQHAFVDLDDPDNGFKNSNNLINAKYNHKAYNDGYHIVHHVRPAMHWTEMAKYYEDNLQEFIDADALVFDGLNDNQHVWWLLMTGNYDALAKHMVDFRGRSHDEKIAYLQQRTRVTQGEIPGIFQLETTDDMKRTKRHTRITVEQALAAE